MKPSVELFKLIKSLTKSEKRFFKLSSSLQSGDKNYLKIFDFIESNDKYDEEELKLFFKDETFIKHLPSEKNHLYKLILKSLRSFYAEQSISSILKQEIKNVEILYNKALYKECNKFLLRAKEMAKENERFYYWYELIAWEKRLLEEAYESGDFQTDLDALIAEEEMVIEKLRNLAEYQMIYSKINLVFRSNGFAKNDEERKVVNEIADYHLIKGKNTAISSKAASMCYYIKGLCAAVNRDYEDSFTFFNRTREILDRNQKIKIDSAQRYVLTLSHLTRSYIENKEWTKATGLIKELRDLENEKGFNSTDISLKIQTNALMLEFKMLHLHGEFAKSVALIDQLDKLYEKFDDKINKEQIILFNFNKAYAYFGVGQYKLALNYLNEILNDNEQNLRQDIYSYARLFNLIIHFELENYDFIEYLIKSTSRYLNKVDRTSEIELACIKKIRKMAKVNTWGEQLVYIEQLNEQVEASLKVHNERVILEYFDIESWVQSKINKISFAKVVQSKV